MSAIEDGGLAAGEVEAGTRAEALRARIEDGSAVCGIIGLGYVGLPLAAEIVRAGYRVLGFDVSARVAEALNAGRSHVQDVPSEVVERAVAAGRLEATTDMSRLAECDVIAICVPTPLSKTRDPDVSYVVSATAAVKAALRPGQLVVLESTTYPGTTRELMLPMLEETGLVVGLDVFLCFSPERVDPGNPTWTVRNTPKVIGGITVACSALGTAIYGRVMETVVPVSSPEAAELTKLLENTFRSINIALVNEMAQAADRLGVNIWEIIDAAATKPFGFMRFTPGPGIGGHCIPLDPHYLAWKMKTLNYRTRMIDLASEINSEMPHFVVDKIQDALNRHRKAVNGSRLLVLGVAYKKDIDDVRESPALDIIRLLEEKGGVVSYHDPHVPVVREDGELRESIELTDDALRATDCVLVATDHSAIDYDRVARLAPLVVDTRNAIHAHDAGHIVGLSGAATPARSRPIEVATG